MKAHVRAIIIILTVCLLYFAYLENEFSIFFLNFIDDGLFSFHLLTKTRKRITQGLGPKFIVMKNIK